MGQIVIDPNNFNIPYYPFSGDSSPGTLSDVMWANLPVGTQGSFSDRMYGDDPGWLANFRGNVNDVSPLYRDPASEGHVNRTTFQFLTDSLGLTSPTGRPEGIQDGSTKPKNLFEIPAAQNSLATIAVIGILGLVVLKKI